MGRKRPTPSLQGRATPAPQRVFGFGNCGSVRRGWGQPVGHESPFPLVSQQIRVGQTVGRTQNRRCFDIMAEKTEGKRKFALWIEESTLEQVRKWYKADNCSSQSEFIDKAIHFYIGFISSENGSDYLPKIIISTLKGIVNDSDNRISRILFKLAVEQAITMNVVAATCNISREQLEKLRGTCVAQVKRTNGSYSFEDAFDFQKR